MPLYRDYTSYFLDVQPEAHTMHTMTKGHDKTNAQVITPENHDPKKECAEIIALLKNPDDEKKALVEKAYFFAHKAHEGHVRKSGAPYITHLAAVGKNLAEMGLGAKTIAAGILHDTIEDTPVESEDIKREFGDEVQFLVEGVTKLGNVRYQGTDRHNESLRKLFVATSQDIRVLIIKLVDRLHNMQTLQYVGKDKQKRIAQETLEIYVPIANRLGMGKVRKELEDLAFPYVYPDEYKKVQEIVKPYMKNVDERLEKIRKTLQKRLAESYGSGFKTNSRVKGTYSLFRKLQRRDWDIDKVYDLLAIRVILPSVEECYRALGIVHKIWRPLPSRMKDYIAFPKPNGYKSIHTTVIADERTIIEIQIRTEDMHREAEYGVASHLIYKQLTVNPKASASQARNWLTDLIPSLFKPFSWRRSEETKKSSVSSDKDVNRAHVPLWIQEIAESHSEIQNSGEFMSGLHQDFFTHRIFLFTPEGDVVDLPIGATPIDFAYAIHSDIGDHISAAKVNNKLVQLNTELKNGDIIEIITKASSHPTRKWLDFAKTSLAQRRIRSALGEQNSKTPTRKNS